MEGKINAVPIKTVEPICRMYMDTRRNDYMGNSIEGVRENGQAGKPPW